MGRTVCVPSGGLSMLDKRTGARLANLWDEAKAQSMSEPELLVYRSNTLGSDKRVTNYGGGNTSSKIWQKDPLIGEDVEVLWVKGSGGDSASIKTDGFATLYMDKLRALKGLYRGLAHEDEMVGSIRARPRSTRRCTPSCQNLMSTTCIPTRSSLSLPRRIPRH
jgi:rhamnose utilization protein RhaD (predicted bifunctional aldolase and dehydrogenase)